MGFGRQRYEKVIAYDEEEQIAVPTRTEANQRKVVTTGDEDAIGLLNSILKELKKINLQLSIITNDDIDNTEVQ